MLKTDQVYTLTRDITAAPLIGLSETSMPPIPRDPVLSAGTLFSVTQLPAPWKEQPTDHGYAGEWYSILTVDRARWKVLDKILEQAVEPTSHNATPPT
jgi:hypothetical protein